MEHDDDPSQWFLGFRREFITVDRVDDGGRLDIHAMVGGEGPPLLLLHGFPQNLVMWRRTAPALARHFTVIATDLRGYGHSDKPPGDEGHRSYAKRTMAADQVAVMATLGFERFAVLAHDRGARVAHQMAIDHRDTVERLVLLDIVPTLDVFSVVNRDVATGYFHWFFLVQGGRMPETLIGAAPEAFLRFMLGTLGGTQPDGVFSEAAIRAYADGFCHEAAIHAACEDYRAAASIDCAQQEADRAADRRIEAPLRVVWGERSLVGRRFDVVAAWQRVARKQVTGEAVDTGHFLAEEAPEATLAAVLPFLTGDLATETEAG